METLWNWTGKGIYIYINLCKYDVYHEKTNDSRADRKDVFRKLKLIFEFADLSSVVLEMAVNMKWKDFEDAIQSATAEYVHADYIITRNIKDFTQSKVMALTPAELLARI